MAREIEQIKADIAGMPEDTFIKLFSSSGEPCRSVLTELYGEEATSDIDAFGVIQWDIAWAAMCKRFSESKSAKLLGLVQKLQTATYNISDAGPHDDLTANCLLVLDSVGDLLEKIARKKEIEPIDIYSVALRAKKMKTEYDNDD